jgi:hypothetical protein
MENETLTVVDNRTNKTYTIVRSQNRINTP